MECPVCYTSQAKYNLVCGHSFCYQCISRWYQECGSHTCPVCRSDISFVLHEDTREVHIEYLRRQNWVEWVMEHRAKDQIYTKYILHGLQGTQEACHKKRQEEPKRSVLTKAYKD